MELKKNSTDFYHRPSLPTAYLFKGECLKKTENAYGNQKRILNFNT